MRNFFPSRTVVFLLVVGVSAWWLGNVGSTEPNAYLVKVLERAQRSSSAGSSWSNVNPFEALNCVLEDGGRVKSTACDATADRPVANVSDQGVPPLERAAAALALVEAREYDKARWLGNAYLDCWNARNEREPEPQGADSAQIELVEPSHSSCKFQVAEPMLATALDIVRTAALRGDYVARDAYVDLLSLKIYAAESQLHAYDLKSTAPETVNAVQQLRSSILSASEQLAQFVQGLPDASDRLRAKGELNSEMLPVYRASLNSGADEKKLN